jgi:hypothetical protein
VRGNSIRQMSEGLPLGHRSRSNRHLFVMNPDPSMKGASVYNHFSDAQATLDKVEDPV